MKILKYENYKKNNETNVLQDLPLKTYEKKYIFCKDILNILKPLDNNIDNEKLFIFEYNLILDICNLFKIDIIAHKICLYFICSINNKYGYDKLDHYILMLK